MPASVENFERARKERGQRNSREETGIREEGENVVIERLADLSHAKFLQAESIAHAASTQSVPSQPPIQTETTTEIVMIITVWDSN